MKLALPEHVRPALEGRLPADVEPAWYTDGQAALEAVRDAEIAWLDIFTPPGVGAVIEAAPKLRWVSTLLAGLNGWPLDRLAERGLPLTNGVGINAIPVAEFAVMGVMAMAKGLPQLIRWQDEKTWTPRPAGVTELTGSKALVIGYGAIGREIGKRLEGLGVEVTGVRRSPSGEPGVLGPDDWRSRLGDFDWVILAAPAVADTRHLIGAAELAAMKPSAVLVNIARGDLIDQPALVEAVKGGQIAGAFLDVTSPEPLPADSPLWTTPGIVMTGHASGRSQTRAGERASALFLDNLARFREGRPLRNLVDFKRGY
jgi:phosphoglycerate dehydrogenase-like enzyme